jgi:predicted ferric reductase
MTAVPTAAAPRPPVYRPAAAPGPRWARDVFGALAVFSMLVVLALWVRGRGIQDLVHPGSVLDSAGRLTGMVSADLLLIQVFLMARVPWLEQAYGQDRLARWHRLVGFTSFDLMLAHVVLITIGYAADARANVVREFWDLVTTYPGMLLALAGTVALSLVVVTSVRAARRRLRYESWHLLHLYAYLGVGLAIPHELWTGTDFTNSGWAQVYWWSAYAVAAGSVLVYRFGVPVWRSVRHRIEVHAVVPEAPGVVSVWLRGRRLDRLPVRPGQFFTWRFLTGPGWTRGHPYSLSAAPRPDLLRITVKDLGDDSRLVDRLRPGIRVLIEGPYGTLTGAGRTRPQVTMLASGIGITPLRALLEGLPYHPGDATLIYRASRPEDLAFRAELDRLAAHRGVRLVYLPGPRASDTSWAPAGYGSDGQLLHRIVPDLAYHDVFICGPQVWMDAAAWAARALGVPEEQLHLETFSW